MDDKTRQFIKKAREVHGNRYSYENTIYSHSMEKVKIVCPIHGAFYKTPNQHISTNKQGCPKCSKRHRPSTKEFIQIANTIHNDRYDYSLVQYKNNHTNISIKCPLHGNFNVTPKNHIHRQTGCPECARAHKGDYHKKNTNQFIIEATNVHGDTYDYSLVKYHNTHTKVKIKCHTHGIFEQTPASHLHQKSGCPKCSYRNYEGGYGKKRFENHPELKELPATLYVIEANDSTEAFLKIGITHKTIHERFHRNNSIPYNYSINTTKEGKLFELFKLEQTIKKQFKHFKYIPTKKFNGHTECFCLEAKESIKGYLNG